MQVTSSLQLELDPSLHLCRGIRGTMKTGKYTLLHGCVEIDGAMYRLPPCKRLKVYATKLEMDGAEWQQVGRPLKACAKQRVWLAAERAVALHMSQTLVDRYADMPDLPCRRSLTLAQFAFHPSAGRAMNIRLLCSTTVATGN